MLHAKYECSNPYGLSQEDLKIFPSLFPCERECAIESPNMTIEI